MDADAVHELLSVTVTEYTPLIVVVAFAIVGLGNALVNPGPDHEYAKLGAPPVTTAERLIVAPEQYVGVRLDAEIDGDELTIKAAVEPVAVQPFESVTVTA